MGHSKLYVDGLIQFSIFFSRFQKHLDKVQDILQNALQSLPDQNEIESNFKVPTDILDHMECSPSDSTNVDSCYDLDRIMCNVIDNMR